MTFLRSAQRLVQHVWPRAHGVQARQQAAVEQILQRAADLRRASSHELRSKMEALRADARTAQAPSADALQLAAFALMHEAVRRGLGLELYGVQHLAAMALADGAVAEMQTGEGKTLGAAVAAGYLSLWGAGVHVVTTNRYLAQRDFEQLGPVYDLLGVTTGLAAEGASLAEKQSAYACDVTYATGYEVGFDYLRDRCACLAVPGMRLGETYLGKVRGRIPTQPPERQRGLAVAIVDEIDSVLLDEGCLPLVLSQTTAAAADGGRVQHLALEMAASLVANRDYVFQQQQPRLTRGGVDRCHAVLSAEASLLRPWSVYVEQALRTLHVLRRGVDYVVEGRQIALVDPATGRIFADRQWQDGLHQMVEAREGLLVSGEQPSAVRISRQRYFRLYKSLCGMTGTAGDSQHEFWQTYRLPVVEIPLRTPAVRTALPERVFSTAAEKWQAVASEAAELHAGGRPVLIGTRTIADSEQLSALLAARGQAHQVLNGCQNADEAAVVASAGQRGAITIATNMAGRGTDIKLGTGVAALGGLHLAATEHNDSQRVDRQLIGRVGRQGDPGSYRFYVSADDHLVRQAGGDLRERVLRASRRAADADAATVRALRGAQQQLESRQQRQRRQMLEHDRWLEQLSARLSNRGRRPAG